MHNTESVRENETHKLLWDFEMQTDHLISARRPAFIIINKKTELAEFVPFPVPVDHRLNLKESVKKNKHLDLSWELKKSVELEIDGYPHCNYNSWYCH